MCAWIVPPVAGLIEPTPAPVIWVDDIGAIALGDGVLTTYYYAERAYLEASGVGKVIELIVKRPAVQVFKAFAHAALVAEHITREHSSPPGRPPTGFVPRLVR